jgi:hypothetical protein
MGQCKQYKEGDIIICHTKDDDEKLEVGEYYKIWDIDMYDVSYYIWVETRNDIIGYPIRYPGCPDDTVNLYGEVFKIAYFDLYFSTLKELRRKKIKKLALI